jgi:hypothetical protein
VDLQHVNVKLLLDHSADADPELLIPIFHSWIQGQVFDELLLDIADYRHVPAGPGVVLIGHQADYSVDNTNERLGVRYNRKAVLDGTNQDRLAQAARAALLACQRLVAEPGLSGKCYFNGHEIELFINDRLVAPNRAETRDATKRDFQIFFEKLFRGSEFSITYESDPRRLFGVFAKSTKSFSVSDLLVNLGV